VSSGARSESVLIELFRLIETFCQEGRLAEALSEAQRAMDLARSQLGEDHPDYATSLDNLANVHSVMGDHAAALPLYQRAAEIFRAALGDAHPDYAQSLHNLAAVHASMGDNSAAPRLFRRATEIRRTARRFHTEYADSVDELVTM
jgi:tetratricopeptide (TPR) repeat protein